MSSIHIFTAGMSTSALVNSAKVYLFEVTLQRPFALHVVASLPAAEQAYRMGRRMFVLDVTSDEAEELARMQGEG